MTDRQDARTTYTTVFLLGAASGTVFWVGVLCGLFWRFN